jgi:transcriptional regulator with XRE-family HTH domain
MVSKIDLGRRIRDIRQSRGLSQADLAAALRVSLTSVYNWEANGAHPRPQMLGSIADVLGVTSNYLLTGQAEVSSGTRTTAEIIEAAAEEIAALNGVPVELVQIRWSIGASAGG